MWGRSLRSSPGKKICRRRDQLRTTVRIYYISIDQYPLTGDEEDDGSAQEIL